MPATNVKSVWNGGDLRFTKNDQTEIARYDGTNGLFQYIYGVYSRRFHVAIADVNAGLTLLAALGTAYKYRLIDCYVISVGGAAAAVTTVDILGTQAASGVKLVAFAQASLTQSALLRAGASGAAILADGASFAANDANTPITIGKTGSSVTTATFIDVVLTYAIDLA